MAERRFVERGEKVHAVPAANKHCGRDGLKRRRDAFDERRILRGGTGDGRSESRLERNVLPLTLQTRRQPGESVYAELLFALQRLLQSRAFDNRKCPAAVPQKRRELRLSARHHGVWRVEGIGVVCHVRKKLHGPEIRSNDNRNEKDNRRNRRKACRPRFGRHSDFHSAKEKDGAQVDCDEPCGREDGHLAKYGDMREEKRRERKDSRRKGACKALREIAPRFVSGGKRVVAVVNA